MTVQSTSPRRAGRRRAKSKRRALGRAVTLALTPFLTAVYSGLLAASAYTTRSNRPVLVAAVLVLQTGVAYGWLRAVGAPGRLGGTLVGVATAAAADSLLLARESSGTLRPAVAALAFGVLAALLHQLVRRDGRAEMTASLAAAVSGATLVVLAAVWLVFWRLGAHALDIALAAVAATALVEIVAALLALPRVAALLVAVTVASGVGAGVGSLTPSLGALYGAALGLAVGLFAAAAFVTAEYARKLGGDVFFAAAVPLTVVTPAAYLASRVLAG